MQGFCNIHKSINVIHHIKKLRNIRHLWDKIKYANLHIIGIPEGKEREKGIENVFEEIMAENFPNLKRETDIQV